MSDFLSVQDLLESSSYADQKAVRDEVAEMVGRLRSAMMAGLTPADMKLAEAEKAAADAADEILSKIFR